jgi:hypothetical protein
VLGTLSVYLLVMGLHDPSYSVISCVRYGTDITTLLRKREACVTHEFHIA